MMGKIITVANQKGGVGKSTIACNLAVAFALNGYETLLVDTDTQESSLNFRALRNSDDIKAISITKPTIHKDLSSFNHDVIVIDAGGRDSATFRSALMASSNGILIIPVLPSVYDVWATQDTLEVLKEARSFVEINAYILINQVIKANIVKEAFDILTDLAKSYDVNILETKLFSRVTYRNSVKHGKSVLEENDVKAKSEMESLFKEVKNILGV